MGDIHLLDGKLINKIAAGEVIEGPASVVKELIENSIDAKSTNIIIETFAGGKNLIKVSDNGVGIKEEDIETAVKRHATSKIKDENDLFSIKSLGFRGEALASIASVSKLTISTRQKGMIYGVKAYFEGGKLKSREKIGKSEGTTVKVEDLFYNTPARRKHLGSGASEQNKIIKIVEKYALINKDIYFKLINENGLIFESPAATNLFDNIAPIYGHNIASDLIKVNYKNDLYEINGYISKPSTTKANKEFQSFYINKRYIKSATITKALYDAYHSLLFMNRHPIAILNIKMDHSKVDVNVHPTKDIVKVDNEKSLYDAVYKAVSETLNKNNLIPSYGKISSKAKPTKVYGLVKEEQAVLKTNHIADQEKNIIREPKWKAQQSSIHLKKEAFQYPTPKKVLSPFRILGQVNLMYIIGENAEGLFVVDQHAAMERINYEKLMHQYHEKGIRKQELIRPKIIELTPTQSSTVKNNIKLLSRLGFEVEEYGPQSFLVRSIPSIFNKYNPKLIYDVIQELNINGSEISKLKEEKIISMACKMSIKAGEEVTKSEMEKLLKELENCEIPYTCPHGRPTIFKLTLAEIEKKFKRTG